MKIRRARDYRHGRIEIIPMIDVMFFLLVTFMLASLSMQSLHSVPVDLPRGEAAALQPRQPVTLTITGDSQIYLDSTLATLDTLADVLKPMLEGPDADVVVATDNGAPAGTVVQAMIQARRAGVEHFLIAVKHQRLPPTHFPIDRSSMIHGAVWHGSPRRRCCCGRRCSSASRSCCKARHHRRQR